MKTLDELMTLADKAATGDGTSARELDSELRGRPCLAAVNAYGSDLDDLVIDHWPEVARRFGSGMDTTAKINLLLQLVPADKIERALRG